MDNKNVKVTGADALRALADGKVLKHTYENLSECYYKFSEGVFWYWDGSLQIWLSEPFSPGDDEYEIIEDDQDGNRDWDFKGWFMDHAWFDLYRG